MIACWMHSPLAPAATAANPTAFTVSSDDTAVRVQVINDRPAVVSLTCRATGFDWIGGAADAAEPMPLIDVAEVRGQRRSLHWHPVTQAGASDAAHEHAFAFTCDDPPLELVSSWEARPGPGPVEHRLTIYNRGKAAVLLPVQPSLAIGMHVPRGHAIKQWWVDKGAGTPTPDGMHVRKIGASDESVLRCWPSGRDTPRDPIPWTSVQDVDARQGWYAGVEFTARVEMALKAAAAINGQESTLRLTLGLQREERFPFFTRVLPGESFEAPPVFIGCYSGDVDDGANRLRRWVRTNLVPPTSDNRYPLLVNNSWGSGMAVDEPLARKMIDQSADLGLELFHIDAGWFRTVGDWRADPKKFPSGLGPVCDYAHQRGLKFGLWVGWTQGGDQVDPTGAHRVLGVFDPLMTPWFCQKHDKGWKANEFSGATVCLGEPQAADWCLNTLRGVIRDAKLDLLEHDQTMVTDGCEQATHRHVSSRVDAGYRAAQGYYHVYDTLRAEHPDLLFENCVNGGHMIDYGALRRCHYISITDTYDPLSNRRAFYDASYALPPATCECYVQSIPVRDLSQFKFMLRSGMMGWCTIMMDTSRWTPQQHDAARQLFASYKSDLRPLIREADLFHVSDRPDGIHWDAIEYFDPKTSRGALLAFRGTTDEPKHRFILKGLQPNDTYSINFEDATTPPATLTGQELMTAGLTMKLPESESSDVVHVQRKP